MTFLNRADRDYRVTRDPGLRARRPRTLEAAGAPGPGHQPPRLQDPDDIKIVPSSIGRPGASMEYHAKKDSRVAKITIQDSRVAQNRSQDSRLQIDDASMES